MLKGMAVSAGIGIGTAVLLQEETIPVVRYTVADRDEEEHRFLDALESFVRQLEHVYQIAVKNVGEVDAAIFLAQIAIAQDPELARDVGHRIQEEGINAEHAFGTVCDNYINHFLSMEDERIRSRAADFRDIKDRLLCILLDIARTDLSHMPEGSILIARDIPPSHISSIDTSKVQGIITQDGTPFSHVSILAKALQLPVVVGVDGLLDQVREGDTLIVDGYIGVAWRNPSHSELVQYRGRMDSIRQIQAQLARFRGRPTYTSDNRPIILRANLAMARELKSIRNYGADGIGLLRTEYMYLDSHTPPGEQRQYLTYRAMAEMMEGKPLFIRTLDLGGDRAIFRLADPFWDDERTTPAHRAISLCLDRPDLFKVQLAAIIRAACHGDIRIILPMITSIEELRRTKALLREVEVALARRGESFVRDVPVGIMVETPAAVLCAEDLAEEAAFFSIGTNDLTQYTLAVNRNNAELSGMYSHLHPAVLRSIVTVVNAAQRAGIPVAVCGEAAADPLALPFLIGLGITQFSVGTGLLLETRRTISSLSYCQWQEQVAEILKLKTPEQVAQHVNNILGKIATG